MRARRPLSALVLGVTLVGAGVSARALERLVPAQRRSAELLYLPNGKYLRALSLGNASLLADLVYLWAIQYYSEYDATDRFRHVRHVFGDVIAELDPHYLDAYWLGAMILTVEAHDLEGGLALLDLGSERNPDEWILPYLAGWECYMAGHSECAARYFERAATIPGAPPVTRRMHAALLARTGALEEALRLWSAILEDPGSDDLSRAIAERKIREVHARLDLARLDEAIGAFRSDNARNPADLEELRRRGYIREVPKDPRGLPYTYDRATGKVSSADRVLGRS